MKYFKDKNNNIYADPININGLIEIDSPIREDGTILPEHKKIDELVKDENGKFHKYYNQDLTPNLEKINDEKKLFEDTQKINEAKEYLSETDYMVIKCMESGIVMEDLYPGEITKREEKRQIIRDLTK